MLSNKLTFSLASLIVLIALGLVFGTIPAIADDGVSDDHKATGHDSSGDATTDEANYPEHMHPTVEVSIYDADGNTDGQQTFPNSAKMRPQVIISNDTTLSGTDNDTETFTLLYTFSHAITAATFDETATVSVADSDGAAIAGITATAATAAAQTGDTTNKKFTVVVTVTDVDHSDGDRLDEVAQLRVAPLAANAVTGLGDPNFTATGGQGNLSGSALFIDAIQMAPVVKVAGTMAGTPSLTAAFKVTFTFDSPVTGLMASADLDIQGGYVVPNTLKPSTVKAPTKANTVWEVLIQPLPGAKVVSVAFAATSAKVAAADPVPTGKMVMLTSDPAAPPPTTDPTPTETKPDKKAAVTGNGSVVNFALTATEMAAGKHIVIANDVGEAELVKTAGYDYTLIEIDSGVLDLADFFKFGGGTIELVSSAKDTGKSLIISEIMWGENETGSTAAERQGSQWIELFSPGKTKAVPTPGAWKLVLTRNARASTANAVDMLTTYPTFGTSAAWSATDGDHGQGGHAAIRNASTGLVATPAKQYISMVRSINLVDLDGNAADVKGVSGGDAAGHWLASVKRGANLKLGSNRLATPGQRSAPSTAKIAAKTNVARDGLVFNEIANRENNKYDWIELWNQGTDEINIHGYILTRVDRATDGTLSETILVEFKGRNDEVIIPAGTDANGDPTPDNEGYLVVANTDPAKTDLAVGVDVAAVRSEPRGVQTLYYVDDALDIPNSGNFLLILRNHEGKDKIEDTDLNNDHEKIVDLVSGNGIDLSSEGALGIGSKYDTKAWPLHAHPALAGGDIVADNDNSWQRDHSKTLDNGDAWKDNGGYTGLGYDRNADMASGSPGYANPDMGKANKLYDADGDRKFEGDISISEIMYQSPAGNRALPQWIEIYNSSMTHSVNLDDWRLTITNVDREGLGGTLRGTFRFGSLIVPPNQTVLLVSSGSSRISQLDRNTDFFPEERVYDLFLEHADELDMTDRKDTILSQKGFSVVLENTRTEERATKGGLYSDEFSNLDADGEIAWELPKLDVADRNAARSSLIRKYIGDGVPDDGTAEEGWMYAANVDRFNSDGTYYGDPDDIGSPGWRDGGPLPVSLSSFRPVRDKATGEVVIRWITQSELNNAGFNILRSETKTGDFQVVNLKGIIPGHGTTSEKHVYTWTDTTAKPNVVYYYQIEDVSLDGKRTTLRTTHLRGNVNAAGKVTTTWGDLKTQN